MEDKVFKRAVTAIVITKVIAVSLMLWVAFLPKAVAEPQPERPRLPVAKELVNIPAYIRFQASLHGVNPDSAVRIGLCESNLDPLARNYHSTAAGLFQWTKTTWEYIGEPGDRFDVEDATDAFLKWYPAHKDWWVCK